MSWYTYSETQDIHTAILDSLDSTNVTMEYLINRVLDHPKVKGVIDIDYDGVLDIIDSILCEDEDE